MSPDLMLKVAKSLDATATVLADLDRRVDELEDMLMQLVTATQELLSAAAA